jgi:hypothetical protein
LQEAWKEIREGNQAAVGNGTGGGHGSQEEDDEEGEEEDGDEDEHEEAGGECRGLRARDWCS